MNRLFNEACRSYAALWKAHGTSHGRMRTGKAEGTCRRMIARMDRRLKALKGVTDGGM